MPPDVPLPGFEDADLRHVPALREGQCPEISNGQRCRYYIHPEDWDHTFGGGLGDAISPRRCDHNNAHEPHAWPLDNPMYTCSGVLLPRFCDDSQRIHLPHDNCPGRDHVRCDLAVRGEIHDPHGFEDRKRAWWCHGQEFCGAPDPHLWHGTCPGLESSAT